MTDRQGGIAKELGVLGNTVSDFPKAETDMQGKQEALSSTTDGRIFHDADDDWLGIKKPSQVSNKLKDPLDWLLADDKDGKDKKAPDKFVDVKEKRQDDGQKIDLARADVLSTSGR